jgi:hypothetical protein
MPERTRGTKSPKRLSRVDRWNAAVKEARDAVDALENAKLAAEDAFSELRDVQQEYQDWLDNLPENLQGSALGEKLQSVADLDLEPSFDDVESVTQEAGSTLGEADGMDLPLGFGRD